MNISKSLIALILGMSIAATAAMADTPTSLDSALGTGSNHQHGVNVSGEITMFRAQIKGLEIGPENDHIDAEILVTLDTQPGRVFGIRYHEEEPSTSVIVETLRQAYLNNLPVTIQHKIAPGKNNLSIVWVQLGQPKN